MNPPPTPAYALGTPVRVIAPGPYQGRTGWIASKHECLTETVYLVRGAQKPAELQLFFFADELEKAEETAP